MPEVGPWDWGLWGAQPTLCGLCLRLHAHLVGPPTSGHHALLVPAEAGPALASVETGQSQPRLLPHLSGPTASLALLGLAVSAGKFPGFNLRICRPSSSRNVTGGVLHVVEAAPGESQGLGAGDLTSDRSRGGQRRLPGHLLSLPDRRWRPKAWGPESPRPWVPPRRLQAVTPWASGFPWLNLCSSTLHEATETSVLTPPVAVEIQCQAG